MKKFLLLVFMATIAILSSCTLDNFHLEESYQSIRFVVPDIPFYPDEEAVKSALLTNPVSFVWEETDTVGIFPNTGSQVFFSMKNGVGTNAASFDGGGWALKQSASYYSYFPLVGQFYLNPRFIPVSFEGQVQYGSVSPIESARFFLASKGITNEIGNLVFNYSILNVILNVNCTLPAGVYTNMTLSTENAYFTTQGFVNLFATTPAIVSTQRSSTISLALDNISLSGETILPLYIMLAPVDLNGIVVTVTVIESTGRHYVCEKIPSRAYVAGARYGLTCNNFTEYAADYPEGVDTSDTDMGNDNELITIN